MAEISKTTVLMDESERAGESCTAYVDKWYNQREARSVISSTPADVDRWHEQREPRSDIGAPQQTPTNRPGRARDPPAEIDI